MNTRLMVFFTFCICFMAGCIRADADNGRFTILEADGRTFLLDTATGSAWRYFYNNITEQGWSRVYIMGLGEKEYELQLKPYSDSFSIPKESVKK